jgi:hypothetical protein
MATTNNTTTTFEDCVEQFATVLTTLYEEEENGSKKVLTEEEKVSTALIVDAARQSAIESFTPLAEQFAQASEEAAGRIEYLEARVAELEEELASRPASAESETPLEVPTLAWLIANPGKGGGKILYGNHIHTKMYFKKFGTFPAAGVWEKLGVAGQAPWKKVAAEYTAYLKAQATPAAIPAVAVNPFLSPAAAQGMSPQLMQAMAIVAQAQATGVLPGAPVAPVAAPVATGHAMVDGVKVTAKTTVYNVWREIERKKRGGVMPVAGEWKNVSAAEKAALTKKVDAVKAMIA